MEGEEGEGDRADRIAQTTGEEEEGCGVEGTGWRDWEGGG